MTIVKGAFTQLLKPGLAAALKKGLIEGAAGVIGASSGMVKSPGGILMDPETLKMIQLEKVIEKKYTFEKVALPFEVTDEILEDDAMYPGKIFFDPGSGLPTGVAAEPAYGMGIVEALKKWEEENAAEKAAKNVPGPATKSLFEKLYYGGGKAVVPKEDEDALDKQLKALQQIQYEQKLADHAKKITSGPIFSAPSESRRIKDLEWQLNVVCTALKGFMLNRDDPKLRMTMEEIFDYSKRFDLRIELHPMDQTITIKLE